MDGDASYSALLHDSIRMHFQRNSKLDKLRSGLHVKAMKLIEELSGLERNEPLSGSNLEQRGTLQLLNYLIVDYFNWFGFRNTLQTFALETGEKSKPKPRERLQQELKGNFDSPHLPVLLQMLLKETNKDNAKFMEKGLWAHIPLIAEANAKKYKKLISSDDTDQEKKTKVVRFQRKRKIRNVVKVNAVNDQGVKDEKTATNNPSQLSPKIAPKIILKKPSKKVQTKSPSTIPSRAASNVKIPPNNEPVVGSTSRKKIPIKLENTPNATVISVKGRRIKIEKSKIIPIMDMESIEKTTSTPKDITKIPIKKKSEKSIGSSPTRKEITAKRNPLRSARYRTRKMLKLCK